MKSWYAIKAQGEDAADIDIFDDIGLWGISARNFINDLRGLGAVKTIKARINSYGGDVFDGIAIYNALKYHEASVEVTVYGIAASIASVIAMAGDKILMPENAFMFVHDPLGFAAGNAADLRELADALDKIKGGLVRSYASKTGQSDEKIAELMSADTWLNAQEAKGLGFADEILEPVKLAARADLKRYMNLPQNLAKLLDAAEAADGNDAPPAPPTAPSDSRAAAFEINELCKKNGVAELAGDFMAAGMTPEQVAERLKDAGAIRSVCAAAKLPDRAQRYIKAGFSLKEARADLFEIVLARDGEHIDNRLPIEERRAQPVVLIDTAEIYARRRRV